MRYQNNFSTYCALVVWAGSAFMAQPTIASLVVHLIVLPCGLGLTVWFAHREGS
jgi:hypothetical protein